MVDTYIDFIFYSKDKDVIKTLIKDKNNLYYFWPNYMNNIQESDNGIKFCEKRQEYYFHIYIRDMEEDDIKKIKKCILSVYQGKVKCAIRYLEYGDSYYCRIDDETNFYYPEIYFIQFSVDNSDYFINEEYCITPKDVIDRIEKYITPLAIQEKLYILKILSYLHYPYIEENIKKILQKRFEEKEIFLDFIEVYRESYY